MLIRGLKLITCALVFSGFIGSSLVAKATLFFASSAKQSAIHRTQFWALLLLVNYETNYLKEGEYGEA